MDAEGYKMHYYNISMNKNNLEAFITKIYNGLKSIVDQEAKKSQFEEVLNREIDDFLKEIKEQQKPGKIQILGKEFVRNNANKGKLIINNRKSCLKSYIDIKNSKKAILKLKMIFYENSYNKSNMFKNCVSLKQLELYSLDDVLESFENLIWDDGGDESENNIDSNHETSYYFESDNDTQSRESSNIISEDSMCGFLYSNDSTINSIYKKKEKLKSKQYCLNLEKMFYNCIYYLYLIYPI